MLYLLISNMFCSGQHLVAGQRTFGSFAILGTLKAARTEALGADVAKVRRGSGVPASLDDNADLDREVTDRRPALLEVIAMTASRCRRG